MGGYDALSADAFFARLVRELRRFDKTWGAETTVKRMPRGAAVADRATVVADRSDHWHVETDFHFLSLDSLVLRDFARPLPVRLARYARAFADYVVTGTAFRIAARSWRFALYFLYPAVVACLAIAVAVLACGALARTAGLGSGLLPALIASTLLASLFVLLAKRTSVVHLMDLWSFSRDFLRGKRPDADSLLDRFATEIVETVRRGGFDEVLLVGHSTGGGLILEAAARALAADPGLTSASPRVSLLTLGSTALKFGLHPAARAFRRKVRPLCDDDRLDWAEFQCMTDPINFYRVDPVAGMGLTPRSTAEPFPLIRQVHMRRMLDPAAYKRIRRNFLRVHYQFVMGNTRRYYYDFHMICFGPLALATAARRRKPDPRLLEKSTP